MLDVRRLKPTIIYKSTALGVGDSLTLAALKS